MWQPLCVDIAGEGHAPARMIDPIDHSGRIAVVPRDGADLEAAVLKDHMNGFAVAPDRRQVVRDEGDGRGEVAQVRERATRAEQTVEEARGGWEIRSGRGCRRSAGSPDIEGNGSRARHGSSLEESRQVADLCVMKIGEKHEVG